MSINDNFTRNKYDKGLENEIGLGFFILSGFSVCGFGYWEH
jgi:hypothetical protein